MADHFSTVVNKLDESFSPQDSHQYGLAVLFSEVSFSYCILDFKRNKYLGLHQVLRSDAAQRRMPQHPRTTGDDFFRNIFLSAPWLKNEYKVTRLAWEGGWSTLVPAGLFDPDEKERYLNLTIHPGPDEQVFADHLLPMDAYQVFSVPNQILNTMKGYFPKVKIVHHSSVLIESIWLNYKNRINASRTFLHVRDRYFDLMIFDGRQMSYFNSFQFHNPEDIVYYLIFVLEQLSFNPESMPLVLLGNTEKGGSLAELLTRYVRHVEFGRRNEGFKYSYLFNQVAHHAHYPLMNFLSCGL